MSVNPARRCTRCGHRRRLKEGLCTFCDGRPWAKHHTGAVNGGEVRAELRSRVTYATGIAHTVKLPTRDHEHAAHAKRLILVAGCRACSAIGHRLPPQNWTGR